MKFCARCLYPENHPLGIIFDVDGVCSGCRVHEEKDSLDWTARFKRLEKLVGEYRSSTSCNYDCIVPVSGGRDSYFIVHTVKRVLGLNPLLVSYNRHYNTRRGLRNYAYLKTTFNCDAIESVVEPGKVKKIVRETLRQRGSFHWHTLAGQTAFPVQVAVRFKIPLIIWGHHQGLDQVGMFSHLDEVEMTRKYRKEHDLMGLEAEDLVTSSSGLREEDVRPDVYPHDKELEKTGVRGIYLGNYIRWDSKAQHEEMIRNYSYETASQPKTFDTYNDVDDQLYSGLHDEVKFMKWGYGKVTDHACREIRLRRMTREQGISLVRKYEGAPLTDFERFSNWSGISRGEFHGFVDRFRDPSAWGKDGRGGYMLLDSISKHEQDVGLDRVRLKSVEPTCDFRITPSRDPSANESEFVLLHKGFQNGAKK
jgi:N-acetyl sugar amidotransferase